LKKFRAEIQSHILPRQRKLFDHGEVGVDEIRPHDRDTGRVAKLTGRRCDKAGSVNPLKLAMASGIRTAPRNLVRTVEVVAIPAGVKATPEEFTLSIRGTGKPEVFFR